MLGEEKFPCRFLVQSQNSNSKYNIDHDNNNKKINVILTIYTYFNIYINKLIN